MSVSEVDGFILVSWSEPLAPNGDLRYNLSLEITDLFLDTVVNTLSFTFISEVTVLNTSVAVRPYFNYTATVLPFTNRGPGPSTTGVFTSEQEGNIPTARAYLGH